jgi:hypothetical protein
MLGEYDAGILKQSTSKCTVMGNIYNESESFTLQNAESVVSKKFNSSCYTYGNQQNIDATQCCYSPNCYSNILHPT